MTVDGGERHARPEEVGHVRHIAVAVAERGARGGAGSETRRVAVDMRLVEGAIVGVGEDLPILLQRREAANSGRFPRRCAVAPAR